MVNPYVEKEYYIPKYEPSRPVHSFMIWGALKERQQALEALAACPNEDGKAALENFVTGMFGDIDALLVEDREND